MAIFNSYFDITRGYLSFYVFLGGCRQGNPGENNRNWSSHKKHFGCKPVSHQRHRAGWLVAQHLQTAAIWCKSTIWYLLNSLRGFYDPFSWMNYLSGMVLFNSYVQLPEGSTSLLSEHDRNILPGRFRELQVSDWELPPSLQMPMPHSPHSIRLRHNTHMHVCIYIYTCTYVVHYMTLH